MSRLLGVGLNLPGRVMQRLRESDWVPRSAPNVSTGSSSTPDVAVGASSAPDAFAGARDDESRALLAMQTRLKEALACAHDGMPDTGYEKGIARLSRIPGMSLWTKTIQDVSLPWRTPLGKASLAPRSPLKWNVCSPVWAFLLSLGVLYALAKVMFARE